MKAICNILGRPLTMSALALAVVLVVGSSAQAATIQLIKLQCLIPQDSNKSGDELRLRVRPNGGAEKAFARNRMRAGMTWAINQNIHFHKNVAVRLIERDPTIFDADERLGSVVIPDTAAGVKTARFNHYGSHYLLYYRVVADRGFVLNLRSLRCVVPQEGDRLGDELRLHFTPDGGPRSSLTRSRMRAGMVWTLNRKVHFHDKVVVRLMERDPSIFDADERLGGVAINATPGAVRTAVFNHYGSHYILEYQVQRE